MPVTVDEAIGPGYRGQFIAGRLAESKALAGTAARPSALVIGADTVVVLDGAVLGKPAHADQARTMLAALRGRSHKVMTGVAIARGGGILSRSVVETVVHMRRYSREEVERYIATGGPFDKAGAYAVQDREFRPAEQVLGCYPNVVGLPLCETARGLSRVGLKLPYCCPQTQEDDCSLCQISRRLQPPN